MKALKIIAFAALTIVSNSVYGGWTVQENRFTTVKFKFAKGVPEATEQAALGRLLATTKPLDADTAVEGVDLTDWLDKHTKLEREFIAVMKRQHPAVLKRIQKQKQLIHGKDLATAASALRATKTVKALEKIFGEHGYKIDKVNSIRLEKGRFYGGKFKAMVYIHLAPKQAQQAGGAE